MMMRNHESSNPTDTLGLPNLTYRFSEAENKVISLKRAEAPRAGVSMPHLRDANLESPWTPPDDGVR